MTFEEAAEKLKRERDGVCRGCMHPSMLGWCENHCKLPEAFDMAIEALEQPEIIYCKDCEHKGTKNCVANAWATIFGVTVKDDFYCGLAERRTE